MTTTLIYDLNNKGNKVILFDTAIKWLGQPFKNQFKSYLRLHGSGLLILCLQSVSIEKSCAATQHLIRCTIAGQKRLVWESAQPVLVFDEDNTT